MADEGRPKTIYDPWGSEDHWYRQFERSAYEPTGLDKLEANLWLESTPFSAASHAWMKMRAAGVEELDGYLPKEEEVFEGIRSRPELWSGAESPQELEIYNNYYADQFRYKDIQNRGGFTNFAAAFLTSVTTDPLNWIGPASSLRLAGSGLRAAGISAASAFPVMVGQEYILGGTQATRTKEEMITGVALGTLLSGAIGGGLGYLSKRQWRSIKNNADALVGDSNLNIVYDKRTNKYYDWTDQARAVANEATELAWVNEGRRVSSDELVEIVVEHGVEISEAAASGRLAQNGRFVVLGDYIQAIDSIVGIPFRPGTTFLEEAQANLKNPDVPWTSVMKELVKQEGEKGVFLRLEEDVPLLDASQKVMDWVDGVVAAARESGAIDPGEIPTSLNPTVIAAKVRRLLTEMDAIETEILAKKSSSALMDVVRVGAMRRRLVDANLAVNRILDDLVVGDKQFDFLRKEDRVKRISSLRVQSEMNPTRQLKSLGKKLQSLFPDVAREIPGFENIDDLIIHNILADSNWFRSVDPLLTREESFPVMDSAWVESLISSLDHARKVSEDRAAVRLREIQEELSEAGLGRGVESPDFVESTLRDLVLKQHLDTEFASGLRLSGRVRPWEQDQVDPPIVDPDPPPFGSSLYHGTRSNDLGSFVDSEGNLVLRASTNFAGRQVGVSLSPFEETAEDYASRVAGIEEDWDRAFRAPSRSETQGMVFEIDASALPEGRLARQADDEIEVSGTEGVTIPAGSWRVRRRGSADDELEANRIIREAREELAASTDEELVNLWTRNLAESEAAEYYDPDGTSDYAHLSSALKIVFDRHSGRDPFRDFVNEEILFRAQGSMYEATRLANLIDEDISVPYPPKPELLDMVKVRKDFHPPARQLEELDDELSRIATRDLTELAAGLGSRQARSLRDELVSIKNQMRDVEARQIEYRGLLDKELREFESANRVLNLIRLRQRMDDYDGTELSGLDVLKLQKQKAIANAMFTQDLLAEQAIEDAVARINRHKRERELDKALEESVGRADTRPVSELKGFGPKLTETVKNLGIENVGELIAYLTVASIKGIGPKRIDAILEDHIAWSGLQDERAANLEKLVRDLMESRNKEIVLPEKVEEGESGDQIISVARGLWGLERKLGRIFSTLETRIMMHSPFQADKRILMKLMDLNLILDQNTTGAVDNPFNAKNIIDFGRSLGHRSVRSGRQQWLYWRDGLNIEGKPIQGKDDYNQRKQRKRLVSKKDFRDLVGRVLHEPEELDKIVVREVRPYVERAVQEMRQQFYLPMLHAYERGYGRPPANEMFSYLLRLYNIRKVMNNKEEMAQAVFHNMGAKLRQKLESQTAFDPDAGKEVRVHDDDEIAGELELLRELIPKWIDGIIAAPGNRPPEDIAEMWKDIPEELRGKGRPHHRRRAFEVAIRNQNSHFDIEVDFNVIAPYLVLDYEEITSAYMKTRLPDIALANVFDGDVTGRKFFEEFEAEFDIRMAAARELESTNPVESARLVQELERSYGQSVTDIESWIDVTRGIYNLPGDPYSWPAYMARAATALKNLTYAQLGGGFGFSALADLGATAMTNGFSRVYKTGFQEMLDGIKGLESLPQKDLDALYIDVSDLSHMRYQNIFDINPYSTMPTSGERLLGQMATAQSHLSFLSPWTNFIRHIGAKTTMRKLVEVSEQLRQGEVNRHDLNLLVRTGSLNEEDLLEINKLWKKHGHGYRSQDNRVALGVEDWEPEFHELKAKVRKLILNEANYNAPTPQTGDKPTLFHSQIGGLLFMFKSFGFGWTHKMMLPHLQGIPHSDLRILNYLGLSVGLASFSYVLKEMLVKGEVPDDIEEVIQQGVVRSDFWGKFATLDDVSSTFSSMDSVLGMIAPTSHYAWKDDSALMGAIKFAAGPAGSTLSSGYDLGATVFNYATGDANSHEMLKAATNFAPYKTNIGIHQMFDMIENGVPSTSEELVLKQR